MPDTITTIGGILSLFTFPYIILTSPQKTSQLWGKFLDKALRILIAAYVIVGIWEQLIENWEWLATMGGKT